MDIMQTIDDSWWDDGSDPGKKKRHWSDGYGASWYLHYDGEPPHDDDNDYTWNGFQWVKDEEPDDDYFGD